MARYQPFVPGTGSNFFNDCFVFVNFLDLAKTWLTLGSFLSRSFFLPLLSWCLTLRRFAQLFFFSAPRNRFGTMEVTLGTGRVQIAEEAMGPKSKTYVFSLFFMVYCSFAVVCHYTHPQEYLVLETFYFYQAGILGTGPRTF